MKKRPKYYMESDMRTLSVKCYIEQLPAGWEETKNMIQAIPKDKYQVIAICHNRDLTGDEFWTSSTEKAHYHIILRILNGKHERLKKLLKMLGVCYRPEEDAILWENHGVESVRDFTNMAVYLTHETKEAIFDGKARYELDELVSNLTVSEIKQIREGYTRVSDSNRKVSMEEFAELDRLAYNMGYELKDFDDWYGQLSFAIRSNTKMKTVRESYSRGVQKRAGEHEDLNRLCIFIRGDKNSGKTYATTHALDGKQVLSIGGGGTGKFDRLSASHDAIVIDDDKAPNILNMCDNYMCQAYRRGSNNPWWCGRYFIVTSNLSFQEWLEECGINTVEYGHGCKSETEHFRAMKSRFYVCHIENIDGINQLVCDSVSDRGTSKKQLERKEMFEKFRDNFNAIISKYIPESETVDYSSVLGTGKKSATSSMIEKEEIRFQAELDRHDQVRDLADDIAHYLEENNLEYAYIESSSGIEVVGECEEASEYIRQRLISEHIRFEERDFIPDDGPTGTGYNILYEEDNEYEQETGKKET